MALTRITTSSISANTITAEKMQNAAIQARHFQTGTITLDLMDANANSAAAEIRVNANLDIVQDNVASNRDSINIVQSNLVLAEANVVQVQQNLTANINTVQSNVDALDLNNITGNVDINGSLSLGGDWTVTETSGVLYFAHSGTNKMKLDSSGNLTVVGDVTAFGTI